MKPKNVVTVCAPGVLALVIMGGCGDPECRRVTTPEAEFLMVGGDYSIVILRPAFMSHVFGAEWSHLTLFYGFDRAVTNVGRGSVDVNLQPLAKGRPILVFSGSDWDALFCPIYALETREMVGLTIKFRDPSVTVESPLALRRGEPQVLPDGELVFH